MYMPLLINGVICEDQWSFIEVPEDSQALVTKLNQENQRSVYPIAFYLANRDTIKVDAANIGILVTGDDELSELNDILQDVSLIAIDFPVLRDGRGFSIARNVTRRGFTGEVRAIGDVSYDRLDNMQRSGFNAYQVSDENYTSDAIKAFTEISVNYQPTHQR
jgi:uncharacterized protein (DUF934 family)